MKGDVSKEVKKVFDEFLEQYLENVKRLLPMSFRAQQLKAGGIEKAGVYVYERQFLEQPFLDGSMKVVDIALNEFRRVMKEE